MNVNIRITYMKTFRGPRAFMRVLLMSCQYSEEKKPQFGPSKAAEPAPRRGLSGPPRLERWTSSGTADEVALIVSNSSRQPIYQPGWRRKNTATISLSQSAQHRELGRKRGTKPAKRGTAGSTQPRLDGDSELRECAGFAGRRHICIL